jgi:hypothetical protein
MRKSARVLGWEFGRTAREMNELLREHGYLYGNPGAYGLTEKGQQFADEQYHSRGTGGYAHYNRSWEPAPGTTRLRRRSRPTWKPTPEASAGT